MKMKNAEKEKRPNLFLSSKNRQTPGNNENQRWFDVVGIYLALLKDIRAKIFHQIDFFEIFTAVR